MACEKCELFGGLWMQTSKGLKRCDCKAGQQLADVDQARMTGRSEPPILTAGEALIFTEMLAVIPFFPTEEPARSLIATEIQAMCRSGTEATWLVTRMARLSTRGWLGIAELRRVYCSKYRPLDGYELIGESTAFPDGVPSEQLLQSAAVIALPPGRAISAAESLENTVQDLAIAKSMDQVGSIRRVRDIPVLPPGARISQADVDRALEIRRQAIGREELYGTDESRTG